MGVRSASLRGPQRGIGMRFGRHCFWIAGILATVFLGDILFAKAQIHAGESIPIHLGETVQFLFLLAACAFFVVGAIERERTEKNGDNPK